MYTFLIEQATDNTESSFFEIGSYYGTPAGVLTVITAQQSECGMPVQASYSLNGVLTIIHP